MIVPHAPKKGVVGGGGGGGALVHAPLCLCRCFLQSVQFPVSFLVAVPGLIVVDNTV